MHPGGGGALQDGWYSVPFAKKSKLSPEVRPGLALFSLVKEKYLLRCDRCVRMWSAPRDDVHMELAVKSTPRAGCPVSPGPLGDTPRPGPTGVTGTGLFSGGRGAPAGSLACLVQWPLHGPHSGAHLVDTSLPLPTGLRCGLAFPRVPTLPCACVSAVLDAGKDNTPVFRIHRSGVP